jgi:uncharacterized membrane protein YesL
MNQFTYIVATRIWQLTVINLTALGLTLIGGVVFGAAPAGSATLHAVHRLDSHTAGELVRVMWGSYRIEFKRTNVVCLPICAVAMALIWNGPSLGTFGFALALCAAMIALCFAAAALLITAHINANIGDTLHNARMALVLSPYGHLVALLALGPWLWLIWQQPLVGFYGGVSVPAFVYSGLIMPAVTAGFPAPNTPITQQEALI